MKTTILTLAAVAAISLGTAGIASANTTLVTAVSPNGISATTTAGVETQNATLRHRGYGYRGGYSGYGRSRLCRRLYYKGFVLGSFGAKRAFYRICRGRYSSYRRMCRKLYVKGFVHGNYWAKIRYLRLCRNRLASF